MSFLIRTLFVVGLIYLLSPLRAELPDWIVNPSPEAARDVTPVLAQSAAEAVVSTCKHHEATCADLAHKATGKAAALVASNDAQAAFEALVKQAAALPSPVNKAEAAPSLPALIEKTAPVKPKATSATASPEPHAAAPNGLNLSTIPLPPRRKI